MSFFDEADEPEEVPRREARPRRPIPRSGGRPPGRPPTRPPGSHNQQVQTRRLVALGVIAVVVILVAVLIHNAQVSSANNSLKTYATAVNNIMQSSNQSGTALLDELKGGGGASNLQALQNDANTADQDAQNYLKQTQELSVPSAMDNAQQAMLMTMKLRAGAMQLIASKLPEALDPSDATAGVEEIAQAGSMLYSSDVDYKTVAAPYIAEALNAAAITIGGTNGVPINGGQLVNDLGWLNTTDITIWIGAKVPSSQINKPSSGTHGSDLVSVSVDGTQLNPPGLGTNTLSAGTPPTFVLNFTNSGTNKEYNVECKVSVSGLTDTGTSTVAITNPGQSYQCSVPLPNAVPAGQWTVTAEVVPVPQELNKKNNFITYSITFN